jgi:hypothetical protein
LSILDKSCAIGLLRCDIPCCGAAGSGFEPARFTATGFGVPARYEARRAVCRSRPQAVREAAADVAGAIKNEVEEGFGSPAPRRVHFGDL